MMIMRLVIFFNTELKHKEAGTTTGRGGNGECKIRTHPPPPLPPPPPPPLLLIYNILNSSSLWEFGCRCIQENIRESRFLVLTKRIVASGDDSIVTCLWVRQFIDIVRSNQILVNGNIMSIQLTTLISVPALSDILFLLRISMQCHVRYAGEEKKGADLLPTCMIRSV